MRSKGQGQRGSLLIVAVFLITAIAAMGIAVTSIFSGSSLGGIWSKDSMEYQSKYRYLSMPSEPSSESEDSASEVFSINNLTLSSGAQNATMNVINENTVEGSIHSFRVQLGNQAEVSGDVIAVENVTLGNESEVGGGICTYGNVTLENHTSVGKDIHSHGNVTLGANHSIAHANLYAAGDVSLLNGAQIMGDIHAGGNVSLGHNVTVHGNIYAGGNVTFTSSNGVVKGNVHSGGNLVFQYRCTIEGSVWVAGSISASSSESVIHGDATAGGSINMGWQGLVKGVATANAADIPITPPQAPVYCPPLCTPKHKEFEAGTQNLSADWQQDITITPGSYGNLQLGGQNKVYLSAGTYVFNDIQSGTQPSLYFDLSAGDVTIFVKGNVSFGDQLSVHVKTGSGEHESLTQENNLRQHLKPYAAHVYLEALGNFSMSDQNEWFGTIYIKNNISFSNQNLLVGAYLSSDGIVSTANQMEVAYVPSNYALNSWEYEDCEFGGAGGQHAQIKAFNEELIILSAIFDDVIVMDEQQTGNVTTGDMSLVAWVKPSSESITVASKGGHVGPGYSLYIDQDNLAVFQVKDESGNVRSVSSQHPVSVEKWSHLAAIIERSASEEYQLRLYHNGIRQDGLLINPNIDFSTADIDSNSYFTIGGQNNGGSLDMNFLYDGSIANLHFFPYAISNANIRHFYNQNMETD
ncbi:LamG-like jellyroll fold domain-containing protein [Desulfurispira natronophila]|uniref:Putative acyltransferase (DUF342 family) n=1 Tax=Desulfurispira natronophila TaxID=682562 RepID=A0A7W7Y3J5_9BACT|nr:LamG-like jellyroll fold domain-containing protein [Desulfurispira natronophila]MBB5021279.1 putative acyltransferase (DUF342 family) [Desulfurispira natronophila]